jgi:hypothetical protein
MPQAAPPALAAPARATARVAPARPGLQAKLEVGPAGDHFERQADSVATAVMRGTGPAAIPPTITPITGAQRKAVPPPKKVEEEKPAARWAVKAQRKAAAPAPRPEELKQRPAGRTAKAQREAVAGPEGGTASASVDASIQAMRSGPAPGLDGATRSFMENRFGRDFAGVRVHHDSKAAAAAQAIGARAFTTGNDIFFNSGEYQPNSSSGRQLIAHELTHTVQQGGAGTVAARTLIQRTAGVAGTGGATAKEPAPPDGVFTFTLQTGGDRTDGTLKTQAGQQEIIFPYLNLPRINENLKGTATGGMTPVSVAGPVPTANVPYSFQGATPRGSTGASVVWLQNMREQTVTTKVSDELNKLLPTPTANPTSPPVNDPLRLANGFYVLGFKNPSGASQGESFIWGTIQDLAKSQLVLSPRWAKSGGSASFEADHILELQLGGADTFANLWLLDARFNGNVGPIIKAKMDTDATEAIRSVHTRYDTSSVTLPAAAAIRSGWKHTFNQLRPGPGMPRTQTFWTKTQIEAGEQLEPLKFLTSQEMETRGFRPTQQAGTPAEIFLFPTPNGGKMWRLPVGSDGAIAPPGQFFYHNMELMGGTLAPASQANKLATIRVKWAKTRRNAAGVAQKSGGKVIRDDVEKSVDIDKLTGFYNVGYVNPQSVYQARTGWDLPGASPVEFSDIALNTEGYLVGHGVLSATKALLPGLRADVEMLPTELRINFPIPMTAFSLGPVTVNSLDMALGVGESGPFLRGTAGFSVASLGTGSVLAEVSPAGPVIAGQFDLALDFLDQSSVAVSYNFATDEFTANATIGVSRGKIPGIDSGTVTVAMTRDTIDVTGTVGLGGPLTGTTINVGYTREQGLTIGAQNVALPLSNLPAVQSAVMSFTATRPPEGGWQFAGTGTATLAAPGATGTLNLEYLNGLFTVTGQGQIARGPATGTLNFTATNRQIDEEGHPIEGPPIDGVNAWGRGSVTVAFGNILTGTAGIEYTPDNRVIISGAIALPPTYQVFPRRDYNRDLFTLSPPEFPIWGVSVAGVGVGIFAFVDARVAFNAFVGPGEIRNAQIGATMDLDRPEDATVTGHGEFHVPAYAGLTLDVGGGLRARATVAYAEGRVGLAGALGVQAGASAAIDISWSRQAGLALSADLRAEARPKFELSANASVTVGVDLLVTEASHTFGPWRRVLGSFGPDMTLGVTMPVRWSEANGLDLSLDNIEVTRPSLDATALMTSVFDQLAG